MLKESIKMSWKNISSNKMRSFLTILGVFIGVSAIIALISIVQGVTNNITGEVMSMGANKVNIQIIGTPLKPGLTSSDLDSIKEVENIKGVSPSVNGRSHLAGNNVIMENVTIQGKNDVYFFNNTDVIQSGRAINTLDIENKNRVCLIGEDVINELFPTETPIDKKVVINGITHTIIGTLKSSNGFSQGLNETVIIPYTTAMNLLGTGFISSIELYVDDESLSDSTTAKVEQVLSSAFNGNEDGYQITNMQDILDTVEQMTGTMSMLLVGIAAISLIVGGIGIMNMMLVTVTERTTEIGLRKALGAKPSAIQLQFVLEALFLSLFGGVLGIIGGLSLSVLGSSLIGVDFVLVSYSIPLAIGFSSIIGLVFGYTPAKKASQLNPIDALRSA